MHLQNY